jgi:hypothetical protein
VSVADDIFSSLSAQGVSQTASVEVYKHFADFVRRLIAARRFIHRTPAIHAVFRMPAGIALRRNRRARRRNRPREAEYPPRIPELRRMFRRNVLRTAIGAD